MCTAITYTTRDHYFGRNLDLEISYGEEVTIVPRNFPLHFRGNENLTRHYAMIGMAHIAENYPLYYEATNEKGLSMAGLNFPYSAVYQPVKEGEKFVTPFELIPWVLGQCATVEEARELLSGMKLGSVPFSEELPLTPLHWMMSDREHSFVIEPLADGLHIQENPVGVLTNEPPFEVQMLWLSNFMGSSREPAVNRLMPAVELKEYSRGMGGMGLPGDLSSASRFVRAAFTRLNSVSGGSEEESVSQFFHILGAVAQQRGCVRLGEDTYEITRYSSCCNTDRGIYYYTTYGDSRVKGVEMQREDLEGNRLVRYPLLEEGVFLIQNAPKSHGKEGKG